MNQLINQIRFHIILLPIFDDYKIYYLGFLERVRASTLSDIEKYRKLNMLLEAIRARHFEHWLNSPLAIIGGTVTETIKDLGKTLKDVLDVPLNFLQPKNFIVIIISLAILAFIVFLIISKLKTA